MGTLNSSIGRTWVIEFYSTFNQKWQPSIDYPDYYTEDVATGILACLNRKTYRKVNTVPSTVKGDMKEGLRNGKPQLSQIPHAAQVYASRSFEYGSQKYERGNYLRPTVDRLADFDRLTNYLDAALRHITKTTTEMNRARGCTDKTDADLMAAAMCLDVESGLPHLCGAMCSIMMGIQQAVDAGLIPADPGQPWLKKTK